MGNRLKRYGISAALVFTALPVAAHHSRTIYDLERSISIEGVVTEFEWANPHVYLYVAVQNETGDPVVWEIEHGSTTAMGRRGWSPDTFVPGDRIVVQANPAKDASRNMALVSTVQRGSVTWIGRGRLVAEFSESIGSSVKATSLSGTWVVPQEQLVGYFSDPYSWPLTERGIEALNNYDDATMNPQLRCNSRTAPWFMIFPSLQRIEIGSRSASIRSEYDNIERIVQMDVPSHDGATVTHQGHSIGLWEGETLVVDSTHFSDHRSGHARGVPSGSQKHLVERFQLDPEGTSLTYRFDLRDPEYLASPVMGEVQYAYRPDLEFAPVECDLENARRFVGD